MKLRLGNELHSVVNRNNNTSRNSTKTTSTTTDGSKEVKGKQYIPISKMKVEKVNQKHKLGKVVRIANFNKVFSKRDSTSLNYRIYTITEAIFKTNRSHRAKCLPKRDNEHRLKPAKFTLENNNQVMKVLNIFNKNRFNY